MVKFWGEKFEKCVRESQVPCGPVEGFVAAALPWEVEGMAPGSVRIDLLQVDAEGYEDTILRGLFGKVEARDRPLVLHFENKVLFERDKTQGTNVTAELFEFLEKQGYRLIGADLNGEMPEDTLALLSPGR